MLSFFGLQKWFVLPSVLVFVLFSKDLFAVQTLKVVTQKIYITKICDAIITEAMNNIGIQVALEKLPTARAARVSNNGGSDAEACRVKGFEDQYQNLIRIDPSLIPLKASVFTKNLTLDIERDNWTSLIPYNVGLHTGHFYSAHAMKDFPNVVKVTTDTQLLRMLVMNRIDAAVLVKIDAVADIKKLGLQNSVKMLTPPIGEYPLHFFLHKKNQHLTAEITKAIEEIVRSGRATEIYNEYLKMLYE